ncbi:hypothetical protein SAMN05444581_11592 [Methylocapsa palsarum]|uniref:Uncharacterized protein n=1 Tax=Methylocapsa palsarum TaxID=1612308 RepID=A0A1I4BP81_9HYPH|nr:hypothetical protein SAMN05444581_11592 [Methylocapsa palsarum]
MIGVTGELGRLAMEGVAGKADDAEEAAQILASPLLGPVQGRSLRVGVDQGDALTLASPLAGEMKRQGRFADPALLVQQSDDHDAPPGFKVTASSDVIDGPDLGDAALRKNVRCACP